MQKVGHSQICKLYRTFLSIHIHTILRMLTSHVSRPLSITHEKRLSNVPPDKWSRGLLTCVRSTRVLACIQSISCTIEVCMYVYTVQYKFAYTRGFFNVWKFWESHESEFWQNLGREGRMTNCRFGDWDQWDLRVQFSQFGSNPLLSFSPKKCIFLFQVRDIIRCSLWAWLRTFSDCLVYSANRPT